MSGRIADPIIDTPHSQDFNRNKERDPHPSPGYHRVEYTHYVGAPEPWTYLTPTEPPSKPSKASNLGSRPSPIVAIKHSFGPGMEEGGGGGGISGVGGSGVGGGHGQYSPNGEGQLGQILKEHGHPEKRTPWKKRYRKKYMWEEGCRVPVITSDGDLIVNATNNPSRSRPVDQGGNGSSFHQQKETWVRHKLDNTGGPKRPTRSESQSMQDYQHKYQPVPTAKPAKLERLEARSYTSGGGRTGFVIDEEASRQEGLGCCGFILTLLSWLLIIATCPFSLCLCIKVVQEYERAVIFRLGRLMSGGAKGPGLFFIIPCMDSYTKVDLRTVSFDVPPQEVLSKDSVTVAVDAVVYYRVQNATISVTNVEDAARSTRLLAATNLRNVLGTKNLSEILADREHISHRMQVNLDEATDPWGVKVERVEIKDVRLPVQLQRAMAAEAEAAREARAKVIAAEGEHKAARALKEAADVISESASALQLRYLQTLNAISAEKNSTIIFPLPIDFLKSFMHDNKAENKQI